MKKVIKTERKGHHLNRDEGQYILSHVVDEILLKKEKEKNKKTKKQKTKKNKNKHTQKKKTNKKKHRMENQIAIPNHVTRRQSSAVLLAQ